ncbi:MAG: hypothetical protein IID36_11775 [Planctomycetes bacterium]|nr:hypothetical protein [Planctomycetota bacterium]
MHRQGVIGLHDGPAPATPAAQVELSDILIRPRSLPWIVAAFLIVTLLTYAVRKSDYDLWGHVTYGALWLTSGVISHDPYAYTTGEQLWIGHEIGAEIVSWLAYDWAGEAGLITQKMIIGIAIALIMWRTMPKDPRKTWLGLLVWLMCVHVISLYLVVRPQLFTYLCTAAAGFLLYRHTHRPTRLIWLLPVLAAVWTNFHGGYVVLIGLILLHLVGPLAHWQLGRIRRAGAAIGSRPSLVLGGVLAASAVATFVNPYGPKIWVCLYKALSNPYTKDVIREWRSLDLLHPTRQEVLFIMLLLGLATAAWGAIPWRRLLRGDSRDRADATGLLVCAVTAVMAIDSYRHIPLFAIVAAPWMLLWGYRAWRRMADAAPIRARLFTPAVLVAVFLSLLPTLLPTVLHPEPRLAHLSPMPEGAVRYIQENRLSGNIYNGFNWGQYLLHHLYPQCKIGMDGRYDTVYSEREYVANFAFVKQGVIDRAVEPPTDFILVRSDGPANKPLRDHADWKILYEDDTARLFGRVTPLIEGSRYAMVTSYVPIAAGHFP